MLDNFTEEETEGQGGSESSERDRGTGEGPRAEVGVLLKLLLHIRSSLPCAVYSSPEPLVPTGPCSGGLGKQQLGALPPHLVVVHTDPGCWAWTPVVPSCPAASRSGPDALWLPGN